MNDRRPESGVRSPESTADLERAIAAIRGGALVGMPTETVYGLAANALDAQAVVRVFAAKGRPTFDPLIVHVSDAAQAWTVAEPSPRATRLAAACWPGPLTLVLPRRAIVPDVVTSGLDTVGVRCPDHPLALALIRGAGVPLAAPSANLFGRISPTTAEHVREQLGDAVAVVLDGGPCRVGIESTVLLPDPSPIILRPGGLTRERLEEILNEQVAVADNAQRQGALPMASPGMLASHYAPRTPLTLVTGAFPDDTTAAVLSFRGDDLPTRHHAVEVLSGPGDLAEAATRLFAALRRLDGSGATVIHARGVPEEGLGLGINDRLRRAAGLG
ncbi:MAG: threonylcarbamoyl-AMP synthase [Planctomycetes bacterium]|nr:threonylcarbamoyl-AMP synthase [Planctomycetota bacterium]